MRLEGMLALAEAEFAVDDDGGLVAVRKELVFKRTDADRQIAYGEVYAPDDVDTHGEYMTAADIEELAHSFISGLIQRGSAGIDEMHDHRDGFDRAYPVESFVAREGDPDFTPGSWVLGTKFVDKALWERVKRGERTGYSFEGLVLKVPEVVEVDGPGDIVVHTNVVKTDGVEPHEHECLVTVNERGNVVGGQTDEVLGHRHAIRENVRTDVAKGAGVPAHRHAFSLSVRIRDGRRTAA